MQFSSQFSTSLPDEILKAPLRREGHTYSLISSFSLRKGPINYLYRLVSWLVNHPSPPLPGKTSGHIKALSSLTVAGAATDFNRSSLNPVYDYLLVTANYILKFFQIQCFFILKKHPFIAKEARGLV